MIKKRLGISETINLESKRVARRRKKGSWTPLLAASFLGFSWFVTDCVCGLAIYIYIGVGFMC